MTKTTFRWEQDGSGGLDGSLQVTGDSGLVVIFPGAQMRGKIRARLHQGHPCRSLGFFGQPDRPRAAARSRPDCAQSVPRLGAASAARLRP